MTDIATMNYVARKPCGCVVGIFAMDLDKKEVRKFVSQQIGYGNTIEQQSDDWVNNADYRFGCNCKEANKC